MDSKPLHRTKERILETALRMFNDFGEPNITTSVLAEEMKISPGNLYYHFSSKEDIVECIFERFEAQSKHMMAIPEGRSPRIDEIWEYLRYLFMLIWKYRFLYRDLSDLLSRNRKLEQHFKGVLKHQVVIATRLCNDMKSQNLLEANDTEIQAVSNSISLVVAYWLSFEYVMSPRDINQHYQEAVERGCFQVLTLLAPYLRGSARELFNQLAAQHLQQQPTPISSTH